MTRAILVELFVQSDDTLSFLLRADRQEPRLERIPLGGAEVLSWTKELRSALVSGGHASPDLQAPLRPLLAAIEQDTDTDDVVCFAPHGPLHLVPFHALDVGGVPLIRRNPVAYTPSASVLASIHARTRIDGQRGAVVVGDTRGDLRHAGTEAAVVAGILAIEAIPDTGRRGVTSSRRSRPPGISASSISPAMARSTRTMPSPQAS